MAPKYPHIHEIKHIELKTESKKDSYQIITFWRLSPKIKGETLILPVSLAAFLGAYWFIHAVLRKYYLTTYGLYVVLVRHSLCS